MPRFPHPPPLSVYVHLPWCVRKCPYCDFNSYETAGDPPERAYVEALRRDLAAEAPAVAGRSVDSVFFGGGTPSLFSPGAIAAVIGALRAHLSVSPEAEITLEANPGTFEAARFAGFRRAGVTRLSLGVQSLSDASLAAIGRIHGRAEALAAVRGARAAGFDNLNVDLMYGLPGQDPEAALADLQEVLGLQPDHVSYYQLTLEPRTPFHHRPPALPDDEAAWEMQERGQALLAQAGYGQYEVSAYARPGRRCRHNLNYWGFGDYLGLGAGAHGKVTDAVRGEIVRRWKVAQPRGYLHAAEAGQAAAGSRVVQPGEAVFEFMLNALRLKDGFDMGLFGERTGLEAAAAEPALGEALARGLLRRDGDRIAPTALGWRLLNDAVALFLPAEAQA